MRGERQRKEEGKEGIVAIPCRRWCLEYSRSPVGAVPIPPGGFWIELKN